MPATLRLTGSGVNAVGGEEAEGVRAGCFVGLLWMGQLPSLGGAHRLGGRHSFRKKCCN